MLSDRASLVRTATLGYRHQERYDDPEDALWSGRKRLLRSDGVASMSDETGPWERTLSELNALAEDREAEGW